MDDWIYIGKNKCVCILIILESEEAQVIDFFLVEYHFALLSQILNVVDDWQRNELGHQQP